MTPATCPTGKIVHTSGDQAARVLARMVKRPRPDQAKARGGTHGKAHPFRCEFCGPFHVGHQSKPLGKRAGGRQ